MKEHNSEPTDHQLILRVQKGDKRAFDLLVLKYQYKLQAIVARIIRDSDEVADVTQEAFIKAYRALPKFRGDSQFYTWLYRIAINTAKNHLVSKKKTSLFKCGIKILPVHYRSFSEGRMRSKINLACIMRSITPENEWSGE